MNKTFSLGAITMGAIWEPLFHPTIRTMDFPPIKQVDCSNCHQVKLGFYPKETKCCSRTPLMVNFLIGSLLETESESRGAGIMKRWIEHRQTDPISSYRPPILEREETSFNVKALPTCEFLEEGNCGIYLNRSYLCMGFMCFHPTIMIYAFWNSLSSLIALTSISAAQYIALQVGLDAQRYKGTWADYLDERDAWPDDRQLDLTLHQRLWEGLGDPSTFYKRCYHYILENKETIHSGIEEFRRQQLLRLLIAEGSLDESRKAMLQESPADPAPLAPTPEEQEAYKRVMIFGPDKHRWTLRELEGHVLWYHRQAYPTTSAPVVAASIAAEA